MAEFASNGKGNAALTTGIIGTALGGLLALGQGAGSLLGGVNGCSDNHYINRYELKQVEELANKDMELSLLKSENFTNSKIIEVYTKLDTKVAEIEKQLCQQAVYNATNTANASALAGQIAQLQSLTKLVIPSSSVCNSTTSTT